MDNGIQTISGSTIISLILHALALAMLLESQSTATAKGKGLSIELISSYTVSDQEETEKAAPAASRLARVSHETNQIPADKKTVVLKPSSTDEVQTTLDASFVSAVQQQQDVAELNRSTSASGQATSIIDLLHTRISESKRYPYLARRQKREGVATVMFTLYPDGSIDRPVLIKSSKTRSLDRAALTAVSGIEPFLPAADYLEQAESFQVDVVFQML